MLIKTCKIIEINFKNKQFILFTISTSALKVDIESSRKLEEVILLGSFFFELRMNSKLTVNVYSKLLLNST